MKKRVCRILSALLALSVCGVAAFAEDANLAEGKSYVVTGEAYDPTSALYCDSEAGKLTDGVVGSVAPWDATAPFLGISGKGKDVPVEEHDGSATSVVIDLEASCEVSGISVELFGGGNGGIHFPSSVKFYYSGDNSSWTEAGSGSALTATDPENNQQSLYESSKFEADAPFSARYIKVEFVQTGRSVFLSEIEVYGAAASGSDESSDETSDEPSQAPSDDESSVPSTGDAGIAAFVAAALVSALGLAFAFGKRRG